MGSEHDPLPLGAWKIEGVARNPPFHYNPSCSGCRREAGQGHPCAGSEQPGGRGLDRSVQGALRDPRDARTVDRREDASHGCIRLTNWDAQSMSQAVAPGTVAVLQE
jgi:hypothetical protein